MTDPAHGTLVVLRHGQSTANRDGLFTGVLDVPLTDLGRHEAELAGRTLAESQIQPADVFTSPLVRARSTARIVMDALQLDSAGRTEDWRLLERNYGALTGRSKSDVLAEYGEERFLTWRRSVDIAPPPMRVAPRVEWPSSRSGALNSIVLPRTESLRDVIGRMRPFWHDRLLPLLMHERSVLVVAHGNSLRALCSLIDELSSPEIAALNIPTAEPLIYRIDGRGRSEHRGGQYLAPERARAAAAVIAHEGGT